MFAFLMNLISTNPWYGPVWFGAIADLFFVCAIVHLIRNKYYDR